VKLWGEAEELDAEAPHRLIHHRHRAGAPHMSRHSQQSLNSTHNGKES
jgi:hypothetical protein